MPADRRKGISSGGADSRIFPMEHAGADPVESRTPLAWQHRNHNYQQQRQQQCYNSNTISHVEKAAAKAVSARRVVEEGAQTVGRGGRRSSSSTTATSSSSAATSKASRPAAPQSAPPMGGVHMLPPAAAASLFGATWDGEPCPVHHSAGPLMLMPPQAATLPRRPPAYDSSVIMMMPPMMRPRPLVVPAANDAGPMEPLPMRDPKHGAPTLPRKEGSAGSEKVAEKQGECHGHSVVLWFIISVITIGILLGAVLRFVMA